MKSLCMTTFKLKSSVKNLVAPHEYVNIKHRNDGRYMKMETYLKISLLGEILFLRTKHP